MGVLIIRESYYFGPVLEVPYFRKPPSEALKRNRTEVAALLDEARDFERRERRCSFCTCTMSLGDRIRGTLADIDPLNKGPV